MDTIDGVNRSLQGPIRLPEDAPPILGAEEAIQAGVAPSVVAPRTARSAPTTPVTVSSPAPSPAVPSVAADFELASKMYVAALANHEKAQERIGRLRKELASAVEDEAVAAQRRDTLQQELLRYLAPAKDGKCISPQP